MKRRNFFGALGAFGAAIVIASRIRGDDTALVQWHADTGTKLDGRTYHVSGPIVLHHGSRLIGDGRSRIVSTSRTCALDCRVRGTFRVENIRIDMNT